LKTEISKKKDYVGDNNHDKGVIINTPGLETSKEAGNKKGYIAKPSRADYLQKSFIDHCKDVIVRSLQKGEVNKSVVNGIKVSFVG
jgi:hypothetical protein